MRLLLAILFLASSLLSHASESGFVRAQRSARKPIKLQTGPYLILTNSTDRIGMYVRGTGNLSIDWGNGSNTVLALQNITNYALSNIYSSSTLRTVVMRGNITYIDSQGATNYGGANATAFGGDISTLPNLTYLYWAGNNTGSGSVAGLTKLTYLNWQGNNTGSGSVAGLTKLTYLYWAGNNTVSGWEQCATNATTMSYMYHGGLTLLSQSQSDGVLNGFWMNRDVAKARATERGINLGVVNDATPSSAGLTVKTNLAAYKSPNGTGPMFWTVTTK